jgi:hypothetical protein
MKGEGLLVGEGLEREDDPEVAAAGGPKDDDGEFKITIRKLELPVRPRGVLAE